VANEDSHSYADVGVLQEKMAIKKYSLLGARFPHLNALVGVQSMACFLWAGLLLLLFPPAKGEEVAPITAYWLPGLANSVGPALGFQALKNISYPAQVGALLYLHECHGRAFQPEAWAPCATQKRQMHHVQQTISKKFVTLSDDAMRG